MEIVLEIVLPVFGVVLLGYGGTRMGWFSQQAEGGLAKFVFDFAIPLMLLRALSTAQLPSTIPWGFFASYYLSAAAVASVGFLTARWAFGRTFGGQVITGYGCAFGNTVLLGLPLILTTFGDAAALPFFILFSVHGLIFFTTATLLLEMGRHSGADPAEKLRHTAVSLIRNPILVGLFVGLGLNLARLPPPAPVESICGLMHQAVTPCALFSLGASLTHYGLAGRILQSMVVVAAKILIMPALVYILAFHVFQVDPLWAQVAVVMAAQPSGVMTYIFAKKYEVGQAIATTSIFLSTSLSTLTLWWILSFFNVR